MKSQMKRYRRTRSGRVLSAGASVPMGLGTPHPHWVYHSPSTWVLSPSQKLSEPYSLAIFMEALSHSHNQLLIQSPALLLSPENEKCAESSKFLIMAWS